MTTWLRDRKAFEIEHALDPIAGLERYGKVRELFDYALGVMDRETYGNLREGCALDVEAIVQREIEPG